MCLVPRRRAAPGPLFRGGFSYSSGLAVPVNFPHHLLIMASSQLRSFHRLVVFGSTLLSGLSILCALILALTQTEWRDVEETLSIGIRIDDHHIEGRIDGQQSILVRTDDAQDVTLSFALFAVPKAQIK